MLLTLIGFPGSGKSTIAKMLAQSHGYRCIDTDAELERQLQCSLPEALAKHGEQFMQKAEQAELLRQARMMVEHPGLSPVVLSTGGSAVYHTDAMHALGMASTVVYLCAPVHTLSERTEHFTNRAIFFNGLSLQEWYDKRHGLYEANSRYRVSTAGPGRTPEVVAAEVARIGQWWCRRHF